jgi:RHS repeat-associated protein
MQLPPGGGCSQPNGVTVNFTNPTSLTTVTVSVHDNCNYSATRVVTIVPPLSSVSASPAAQSVNCGGAASTLSCSLPTKGDGTYNYQWQTSTDNINWSLVSGANNSTYTPTGFPASGTTYYRVIVTSFDYTQYSNSCSLTGTSTPPLTGGNITSPLTTINYNTTPATLVCSAATGGSCSSITYTYKWQSSSDGNTWAYIIGATGQNYSPGSLTSTTYYRRETGYNGSLAYSNAAIITVYPQLLPGSISPSTLSINYNTSPGEITGTLSSGGSGVYSYQWQSSANGSSGWTNISYATDANYTPPQLITNTWFRRVTTSNGLSVNSNTSAISVQGQVFFAGGIITSTAAIVSSGGSITLSSTNASGGNCGTSYAYQYQSSTDEQSWINISSTVVSNITKTTYFRRQATCGTDVSFSNTIRVKVEASTPAIITPNTSTSPAAGTATAVTMPGYGTADVNNMNYIKTRVFTSSGITTLTSANSQTDPNIVHQTTEYFDGLGRSIQTVSKQTTPLGYDMIAPTFYDPFGRVEQQYLPYTDNIATGGFRTDAATKQPAFYNTQLAGTEGYYYSNTIYEASPLNTVLKTTAPGKSWTGHNVGTSQLSRANEVFDSVRIWNIGTAEDDLPTTAYSYNPGTLYVHETTDENDNKVLEYKDLEGQVILKKVQQADAELPGHYGWLCTYYIYDDFGNLRFVIPPRAVEYLQSHTWTMSLAIRDNLCFSYLYDGRNRMIVKQVPNGGKTNMVYNARDLLVMSQDANEKATSQWNYIKYDRLNRIIGTGLYPSATSRASYQLFGDTATFWPGTAISDTYLKSQTFYDDYSWVTSTIASSNGITGTLNTTVYSGFTAALVPSNMLRGSVTGSMNKTLEGSQAFYTSSFYDDRGRVIQTQSNNISATNAVDYNSVQYDFAGKPVNTFIQHNKKGILPLTTGILTKNTYDAQGRLLSISKAINGGTTKTIGTYSYNELGQMKTKSLGALDVLTYTYNIRGWMNSINKPYLAANTSASVPSSGNYFGLELNYDYGFNQSQLNGNIAGAKWKSAGDQFARAFGYDYDNANRILKGDFTQTQTSSSYAHDAVVDFSVSGISYDANGNLMSMKQNGLLIGSSSMIDNLSYKYSGNTNYTNQLSSVTDAVAANNHLGDFYDANTADNDYTYDANGNLTSDKNKAIASIVYNYLNLPETITITGKGTISYVYDAAGNKLKKTVIDQTVVPNKTTVTAYVNGFVYQNDTLQFIGHEEGRIRPKLINPATGYTTANINWMYDYFEKDHLGNVRMVLTEEKDTALYPAVTFEDATLTNEQLYYENVDVQRTARPGAFFTSTTNGAQVQLLRKSTSAIGAGQLLKVMAGDKINTKVDYYIPTQTTDNSTANGLSSILNSLISLLNGADAPAALKGSGTPITNALNSSSPFTTFMAPEGTGVVSTSPKAYLNIVFFDEQFKFVQTGSQLIPANVEGTAQHIVNTGTQVPKNGYVYIYVSNESNDLVYFDNLQITHLKGPILEETHYYPFGLTMAGISSKAAGELQNKEKTFQGQRFDDDLELNWVQFKWRNHDPQIGRFIEIDPLANDYLYNSTYAFSENKVTAHIELEGLESIRFDESKYPNRGESTQIRKPIDCRNCTHTATTPIFTLTVTKGKQAGLKVGGFGAEINAGSKEVLKVTDADPGTNTANKNKTITGAGISIGVISASKESTSESNTVKNKFGSTNTTETRETTRNLTFGLKNTALSAGVQNTETTTSSSNSFMTFGSTSSSTGPKAFLSATPSETEHTTSNGTPFSFSLYFKVEINVNFQQMGTSILQTINTAH